MSPPDNSPVNNPRDAELDALLGAYALDALDEEERVRVERYIATNRAARDEVDQMLESAASLALAPVEDTTAPGALWAHISSNLDDDDPEGNVVRVRSWRRRGTVVALGVAAAIAIVILAASLVVVADSHHNDSTDLTAAFHRATGQKGAREVTLTKPDGATVAHAVLLPDGSGYLENAAMAVLPEGKTYQLWGITGPSAEPVATSVGVLGADPRTVAFHTSGGVGALGLSIEREPGVQQPTQPIYASATMGP